MFIRSKEALTITTGQDTYNYTEQIRGKIKNLGADLVGVADTGPLKQLRLDPPDLTDSFERALSIALSLPKAVLE